MTSGSTSADCFGDTPTDFEDFVAREHGLAREQAAQLIVSWLESYESSAPTATRGLSDSFARI